MIELLIVIAILAILATAVALVLNPAELLKQGRDSTRLSDLATLQSALALYLADVSPPIMGAGTARCTVGTQQHDGATACTNSEDMTVTGSGWVDVDFDAISGGSPLSRLPLDPTQSADFFYVYVGTTTPTGAVTFELNAELESEKFNVDQNLGGKDGGNAAWYEVGTDPGLDLLPG